MMPEYSVPKCEVCGGGMKVFLEGRSQGMRCENCGWSVVTIYTPEIDRDQTTYVVRLVGGDFHNAEHVKLISLLADVNFLSARKLLQEFESQPVLASGKARDIALVREKLQELLIPYLITPDFRW